MRFLLVDRIHEVEPGTRIRGAKCAAMSEDYFEWHFPERPIVPGMLILEACTQLAGWLEAATSDFANWAVLEEVKSARYYDFALPGDVIELELTCTERGEERSTYLAETRVGEKRGAALEFVARTVALDTLEDPARMQRQFDTLRRETT